MLSLTFAVQNALHRSRFVLALLFVGLLKSTPAAPLHVVLVPQDAEKRVLVPRSDVEDEWRSAPSFDDSEWLTCNGGPGGIGFDRAGDYAPFISLNLGGEMGGQTSCYVRALFNLDSAVRRELDRMTLLVRYDDGFVAYLNGEPIAAANAPLNLHRRAAASQPHEAQRLEAFDVSQHVAKLKSGANVLAFHALNVSGDSPDFLLQFKLIAGKNYRNNFVSDLPIIVINRQGETSALSVIDQGGNNRLTSAPAFSDEARLEADEPLYCYEKASYRFTLLRNGRPIDAPLLGLPEGDRWRLSAPFSDKTLVRSALLSTFARRMGRGARGRLCHLFIDQDYRGIYLLLEERNVHRNRIDVAVLSPEAENGLELTGGYLLRLDHRRKAAGFDSDFFPFENAPYRVHYLFDTPPVERITTTQMQYIRDTIKAFETAAHEGNAAYLEMIDLDSFVDYFLLNEISRNVHGYRDRTLLFKDRDDRNGAFRIELLVEEGGLFGASPLYSGERVEGFQLDILLKEAREDSLPVPFWWRTLRNDRRFTDALYRRWTKLRADVFSEDAVFDVADSLYQAVKNDQVLNFERWMIMDRAVEPSKAVYDSYDEAFDNLLIYLLDRLDWLDEGMEAFRASSDVSGVAALPTAMELVQNVPNPFNGSTIIEFSLAQPGTVTLDLYNLRGEAVVELFRGECAAGRHQVILRADGLASGIYICKLHAGTTTTTKRLMLVK